MPRYYCDYCDTYLTHDSPSVRKQHNSGYKHKANIRAYYQQFEQQQTQSLIDQKIKEHLGEVLNVPVYLFYHHQWYKFQELGPHQCFQESGLLCCQDLALQVMGSLQ
ncbi:hypothetical protein CsSME_00033322 [Camellia sinensis var. sinensis]